MQMFSKVLTLRGHHGDVWGLAVSHLGDYLVSVSVIGHYACGNEARNKYFRGGKERELNRKIEEDLNRSSSGVHGIGALTNEESAKKANEGLGIVTLDSAAAGPCCWYSQSRRTFIGCIRNDCPRRKYISTIS